MKYTLDWDQVEFEKADRLVRAVLLQSGKADFKTLRWVTTDHTLIQESDDRASLEDPPVALGVCTGYEDDIFDIWITPQYKDFSADEFHDTVLHELSHGYLGLYKHNQRFRRFLARVMYHYSHLVHPIDHSKLTSDTIRRYTLQGVDESFPKYVDRMFEEQTSAEKVSVAEAPAVAQRYRNLKGR